jgi:hypothetical protein
MTHDRTLILARLASGQSDAAVAADFGIVPRPPASGATSMLQGEPGLRDRSSQLQHSPTR